MYKIPTRWVERVSSSDHLPCFFIFLHEQLNYVVITEVYCMIETLFTLDLKKEDLIKYLFENQTLFDKAGSVS